MKFGQVDNPEGIDFDLPKEPQRNQLILGGSKAKSPKLYVGSTQWTQKEWLGSIYPKGSKAADFLYHYSQYFNTIELNATHYRNFNAATVERWRETVPDGFRFCPKMHQVVSHRKMLRDCEQALSEFVESTKQLENKLGCYFMQMPERFGTDKFSRLETFVYELPENIKLAMELRQAQWFSDELFAMLEAKQLPLVITDTSGRRDVVHMRLTSKEVIIRWVGNNGHPTDFYRLDLWREQLDHWFAQGLENAWFFIHQTDAMQTLKTHGYLAKALSNYLA